MKRIVCVVLCGMLLLTGCQQPAVSPADTPTTALTTVPTTVETTAAPTTTATTIIKGPSTTTTAPLSQEQEMARTYSELIEEFLQTWQAGDAEGLSRFTGSAEIATLLAEGVTVESYRLGPLTADKPHRLTLSVSASSVPVVPKGESEWWIWGADGAYVQLCPIDEDYTARWSTLSAEKDLAVWFCSEMATELDLFGTVEDFSRLSPEELGAKGGTLMRIYNAWLKATEEDPELPYHRTVPELSWFTERVLGVNVSDFSASPSYISATETEEAMVGLSFPGGKWHYAGLVDHTQKDGVHTVTLCYYADITRLMEAVTMRYTARHLGDGTFRLLSSQRLSGGSYPPAAGAT